MRTAEPPREIEDGLPNSLKRDYGARDLVDCPHCGAQAGTRCRLPSQPIQGIHLARRQAFYELRRLARVL